jgi:hypothetical protein
MKRRLLAGMILGSLLLTGGMSAVMASHDAGHVSITMPPGVDPGAVLSREIQRDTWRRQTPFLFQMTRMEDVTGIPSGQVPDITYTEGVLPLEGQTGVRGVLKTPGGSVYIGPLPGQP